MYVVWTESNGRVEVGEKNLFSMNYEHVAKQGF
jgi:hypothetical protein